MSTKSKHRNDALILVALGVLFVAVTILNNTLLRGARLDLTENQLYTVAHGTRNLLGSIDEPISLYLFFSQRATESVPYLRTYANRVRELLEELALESGGKLNLTVIDPLPFSEEEDRAASFGLQAITLAGAADPIYFGLAGTNAVDDVEIIQFFQPDKEQFLEYDIAKLIYTLLNPDKPVVGLMSTLPMTRGIDPQTGGFREPWVITQQMEQLFEVRTIDSAAEQIPRDLDVLVLVHPKALQPATLYAIDQYVLGGGKALIFVDPHAEQEVPAEAMGNPSAAMFAERSSDLGQLLSAWGVSVDPGSVVADARYALTVGSAAGRPPARHLALIGVSRDSLAAEDVVTATLNSINLAYAGIIRDDGAEASGVQLVPLLRSSADAMPVATDQIRFLPDPASLLDGFSATGEQYVVAARLEGEAGTAFPDGPPGADAGTEDEAAGDDAESETSGEASADDGSHLETSTAPINVILVADTDLLSDRMWVQVQNFFGQRIPYALASNGDFVINALDNLAGSSDLISIRGRASFSRPFTRVDALRRDADAEFRDKEQELQRQLAETERRLVDLQQSREDDNPLILSSAQEAELDRFRDERVRIRKELRQVQRDLDKNIEGLGTRLKLINIGLMPLLIVVVALTTLVLRSRRQRR